MGESRSQQAWAHTSSVLALLANIHRDSKKTRAYKPADFNPHIRKSSVTIQKVGISVLKQVFISNQTEGS
jgi:hypothetical protein